ncbi:MAG: hypothetical protein JO368_09010 [Acidimicrobiales bacterium]|nr:hypothetical protein [Acidimicrobiales bacterium]
MPRWPALVMPLAVGTATLVLRLLTAARGPTDWDSAQYAAGVRGFDVTHGRPQPPGYWLYVAGGRLVHAVSGLGTIHSLVLVAALASAAAAAATAVAGRDLGGTWVGLAAGAVMATCPFVWFSGSVVATYSFDALACAVLVDLAWRARPGSWHGIGAAVALGLLAGFRPSILQSFVLLGLIPVVAATRRLRQVVATLGAGAAALALWFVPMALQQPGGAEAWWRATRIEADGAAQATSVFDHAAAGATNLGTFAAYTVVALAPLAVVTLLAALVLAVRGLGGSHSTGGHRRRPEPRPWYQRAGTILAAAIVPPMALVALVQFAKGGYLLAYLPAATIALLLPVAATFRSVRVRAEWIWLALASVGVAAVVLLGAQRFLDGQGVLPASWTSDPSVTHGLWLRQPRYQAPYADTRSTIRQADAADAGLAALRPALRADADVLVLDTVDGGGNIYRNAGWALPHIRVALLLPGGVQYNELEGSLYYTRGRTAATVAVGPPGSALLLASPALPGLQSLVASGAAVAVPLPRPIGGYRAWRVRPGAAVLGVPVVARAGPRPLGTGIS